MSIDDDRDVPLGRPPERLLRALGVAGRDDDAGHAPVDRLIEQGALRAVAVAAMAGPPVDGDAEGPRGAVRAGADVLEVGRRLRRRGPVDAGAEVALREPRGRPRRRSSSTSQISTVSQLGIELHALDAVSDGLDEVVQRERRAHRVEQPLEQADLLRAALALSS